MTKITYSNGETPRICIVGAGISGLCAAIQLKKQLGLTSFTIFEANKDIGGTWFSNRYPGCACDIPSHLYSFSFELNPDWSENYSSQPEIWHYLKNIATKYELYPYIKFEKQIRSLTWEESMKKWKVLSIDKNSNPAVEFFDLIINGPGALRIPNIPEQFKSFQGPLIHSAEWDSTVDLKDKVVGIIGSGASAVQIIPAIAKDVKELYSYQRKPAYILPRSQWRFPQMLKTAFRRFPLLSWFFRVLIFLIYESVISTFKKGSRMNEWARKIASYNASKQLNGNSELQEQLTPNYTIGCKRISPSDDYYPTLIQPHVKVITKNIVKVTSHGIITEDGILQNLDVLILATGYRVHDYFAPMEILGRNSENILETWKSKVPRHYYGITGSSAPNHFALLGPNTGIGNNSAMFMIECQTNFAINVIREMMKRDAHFVVVKKSAENSFMDWLQKVMKSTVWGSTNCGSWYANQSQMITTLWPESCTSYWFKTRKVNFSHFEFN